MSESLTESVTGLGLLVQIAHNTRDISRMMRRFQTAGDARAAALTIAQAARKVNVSETTIRRAICAGDDRDRLTARNLAKSGAKKSILRIEPADLDAWMKRRAGGAPPPARPMTRVSPRKSRHFKV